MAAPIYITLVCEGRQATITQRPPTPEVPFGFTLVDHQGKNYRYISDDLFDALNEAVQDAVRGIRGVH